MARKSVPASIREVAFDCPHCGAYTTQTWYNLFAKGRSADDRTPGVLDVGVLERITSNSAIDDGMKDRLRKHFEPIIAGLVVLDRHEQGEYVFLSAHNNNLSKCFSCDKIDR